MAMEQIPVTGEFIQPGAPVKEGKNQKKGEKVVDANVVYHNPEDQKRGNDGGENVLTQEELSAEEAEKQSDNILNNPETQKQIENLIMLGKKYENGELKDMQKEQYENLMTTIRTELDRDVPTVIEMNKEIDVNYYNKHPEAAAEEADRIVNNYENMNDAQLVNKAIKGREYLGETSQQKLDTVTTAVINELNGDAKALLNKE